METLPLAMIATIGGFTIVGVMGLKVAFDLGHAWRARSGGPDDRYLQLYVNGKDFSVDLRKITNGGSETIREALNEAERNN